MDLTRIQLGLPARVPPWIAAIFIGLLVASGTAPIIRAFSPSYAGIPVERAPSVQGADLRASGDAHTKAWQLEVAATGAMIAHRNRVWCAECGVVESMRQLVRSGDAGDSGTAVAGLARSASGGTPSQAISSDNATRLGYEFTVRFRDGSAIVFDEATPRTWRSGSRVIVVGRTHASTDLR
jgi:outer membrane lipoprotein SlyB